MKWLLSVFNVGTDRHLKFAEILKDATRMRHSWASSSVLAVFVNSSLNNKIMASPAKKACQQCHRKCGRGKVPEEVIDELERAFGELEKSTHQSLLKKYLTREVFDDLKTLQTPNESTLLDCIRSGIINLDSGVGVYAPDSDAYVVFDTLFDPIIEDYHMGFGKNDKHPPSSWGNQWCFENVDPKGEYVVSTRVRCARSVQGYPFNPRLTEDRYKEMEKLLSEALSTLNADLKGTFYPLSGMTKDVQQKLIDDHFLFKEGDRFLEAANSNRFWPTGRGIFHNENKTFLVWVNEEDHVRIISMQQGGDLGAVYRRLVNGVRQIEKKVQFARHPRLGYLTFCPTNLGTTIRASVHMKLPRLALDQEQLEATAKRFNLQIRGTRGEHSDAEGGVYDVSNKRRLGLTEFQAVKEMYEGILELIQLEKKAAKPTETEQNEP